ncbi:hypothetical protein PMY35_07610 [Clostridium tertium]|uniref:hypothetical protein n=1 Tax=Clostridium tertium TaxID=1559 RepID=UPI00189E7DD5|nr:hypothetical protein [Clostridium tertium]MDB1947685.1 hypothetical protein [Clostridium tertium]
MENSKEILKVTRRLRNIDGCIIAELDKGRRVTINPEIIEGFIRFLGEADSEALEVDEVATLVLMRELIKVLENDGYEVRLK